MKQMRCTIINGRIEIRRERGTELKGEIQDGNTERESGRRIGREYELRAGFPFREVLAASLSSSASLSIPISSLTSYIVRDSFLFLGSTCSHEFDLLCWLKPTRLTFIPQVLSSRPDPRLASPRVTHWSTMTSNPCIYWIYVLSKVNRTGHSQHMSGFCI